MLFIESHNIFCHFGSTLTPDTPQTGWKVEQHHNLKKKSKVFKGFTMMEAGLVKDTDNYRAGPECRGKVP